MRDRTGTALVTAQAVTEIGSGLYRYTLASGSNTAEGEYLAVFSTSDTTVDQKDIPALWIVSKGGIENLDAAVSSRNAIAPNTVAPDNAGIATLTGRLSATRAGNMDNLPNLDVLVSSRNAVAPDNAGITTANTGIAGSNAALALANATLAALDTRLTSGRAGNLDNLDVPVSTRATAADVNAGTGDPLANEVPGDYAEGTAGAALARIGALGTGVVTVTTPVSADARLVTLIQGDTYDVDQGRGLLWSSDSWPNLTGATIVLVTADGEFPMSEWNGVLTLELTAEQTAAMRGGKPYVIVATLADGHVQTLATGQFVVKPAI